MLVMNLTEIKPCRTFDSLNDPISKEKIQKTIKMWKNNKTSAHPLGLRPATLSKRGSGTSVFL